MRFLSPKDVNERIRLLSQRTTFNLEATSRAALCAPFRPAPFRTHLGTEAKVVQANDSAKHGNFTESSMRIPHPSSGAHLSLQVPHGTAMAPSSPIRSGLFASLAQSECEDSGLLGGTNDSEQTDPAHDLTT